MKFENRRKYHRINFGGTVNLEFRRHSYGYLQVRDLSLTGMFIKGDFQQRQREHCHIKIFHKEKTGNNYLRALGEVVWSNNEGVGLKFITMTVENYILLQTTLIYQAEEPEIILREFPDNCPFEISH